MDLITPHDTGFAWARLSALHRSEPCHAYTGSSRAQSENVADVDPLPTPDMEILICLAPSIGSGPCECGPGSVLEISPLEYLLIFSHPTWIF